MSPEQLLSFDIYNALKVLGMAASPICELRCAIPWAVLKYEFPWYYAFLVAIIGNMLPVPFILLFLNFLSRLLSKISSFEKMLKWLFDRVRRRGRIIERYKYIGLMLFVAIPLPITGAWTGSIAAVLFGLEFKNTLLFIFFGILIAGTIVTLATLLGWAIFGLYRI